MNQQSTLFGSPNAYGEVQAPAQCHSPTSMAAAESIKPHLGALQQAVLAYLHKCGERGATDEEGMDALAFNNANTYRPRRIELCQAGLVHDSGHTRLTRSKRSAVVWVAR